MAKQPLSLKVRLTRYESPWNEWRKKLHASIMAALKDKGIEYTTDQKLVKRKKNKAIAIGKKIC